MRKRGIVLAAVAAVAAFAGGTAYGQNSALDLKPCVSEDSVNCYWDAGKQGNGRGMSFVVDQAGNVTHVSAFNDGFTESKADDCEQGFQLACSWLAETR
ncbi:hypothetical protein U5640_16975 [Streptomyces sp. SS7]|uniref:hypothetical protein n=1 Tax=Streptomyces sp. SS7 TaxID=3108485 RepID=UPI0030EB2AAE